MKPINLSDGITSIHPLRDQDLSNKNKYESIEKDLFEIFGNKENLPFSPERHILNSDDAQKLLLGSTFGYHSGERFDHFISLVDNEKTIGIISIISPKKVELTYGIIDGWMIEFYLNRNYWNQGIITGALRACVMSLINQNIFNIAALVDKDNLASIRVLQKSTFRFEKEFDMKQDLYIVDLQNEIDRIKRNNSIK